MNCLVKYQEDTGLRMMPFIPYKLLRPTLLNVSDATAYGSVGGYMTKKNTITSRVLRDTLRSSNKGTNMYKTQQISHVESHKTY